MAKAPRLTVTRTRTRVLAGALIGLLVFAIASALRLSHAVEGLERRLVDTRTGTYLGTRAADPEIVLAVIDDVDLQTLGQLGVPWEWSLDVNAYAFEWMREAGARAIVVDMLHVDLGSGPEEIDPAQPKSVEKAAAGLESVTALANAFRGNRGIALGYELLRKGAPPNPFAYRVRKPAFERALARAPVLEGAPTDLERADVNLPVVRLLEAASVLGYVNAQPDDDGITRRTVPLARVPDGVVASLPLAAALLVRRGGVQGHALRVGDALQRLDAGGGFLVNFRGREDSYAKVRVADMVNAGARLEEWTAGGRKGPLPTQGTAVPEAVRDKIVVWGMNAAGAKDVVAAPISERFPGPEMQATVLDDLLHGDGRVRVSRPVDAAILAALCLLLGLVGGAARRRGQFLGTWVLLTAGLWLAAFRLFAGGWSIDLFTPTLAMIVTYAGVTGYFLVTEGRRNKWLEGTFGQYLSPTVIEALKKDPTMLDLGGRRRELSVFFSDVRGFTTISEALAPDDLVRLLNDYLTRQSARILAEDGVIDKFIGDAVMAFFGDPVPHPDHAVRACRAAVRCLQALEESQPLARSLGIPELVNRIGINSGPAFVGNMGSDKRFNYTCMGDTVNLASRLEGANKAFGSHILMGPLTYERAKDEVVSKPLARLRVVGKTEPVAVHELLGLRGEVEPPLLRHAAAFQRAHAAVLADRLDDALLELDEAEASHPGDGPVAWLRGLVADLREGRVPRPWDGVYVLESK